MKQRCAKCGYEEKQGSDIHDISFADTSREKNIEFVKCPAIGVKVAIYRGVCQDWKEIKECLHGFCGLFPALDKTPVVVVDFFPRTGSKHKVEVDIDGNVVRVGKQEIQLQGKTFGAKIKEIREKLSHILDNNQIKEVINEVVGKRKVANIRVRIGDVVWLKSPAHVVEGSGKMMWGEVDAIKEGMRDGSKAVVISDGSRKGWVIKQESVIKVASYCKNYRRDTGVCKTGCPAEAVATGGLCGFMEYEQEECKCYRR